MIKRTITIILTGVATLFIFSNLGKTQKVNSAPINKLPDVIINGTSTGVKGYVASFVIEDDRYPADKCPASILSKVLRNDGEYTIELNNISKHCPKCLSGIFTAHEDGGVVRRCTFCNNPEE